MIKVLLSGVNGKMGQVLASCIAEDENMVVVAGVDKFPDARSNAFPVYGDFAHVVETPDVIIDFSRPDALSGLLSYAQEKSVSAVLATTGYTDDDKAMIAEHAGRIPLFYSANMSLGVNLQMELAKKAAEFLGTSFDIEIIEKHHNQKVDAPSGTALAIADHINSAFGGEKQYIYGRSPETPGKRQAKELGIHAVRGGSVVGQHDVLFLGNDEVIEIRHSALSKHIFAEGAMRAAKFLSEKGAGLYSMFDIIAEASAVMNLYTDEAISVIKIAGITDDPHIISAIFSALHRAHLDPADANECQLSSGMLELVFSLPDADLKRAASILSGFPTLKPEITSGLTKLTLEGTGVQKRVGATAVLLASLADEKIKTHLFSASNLKISVCIDGKDTTKAVKAITQTFKL